LADAIARLAPEETSSEAWRLYRLFCEVWAAISPREQELLRAFWYASGSGIVPDVSAMPGLGQGRDGHPPALGLCHDGRRIEVDATLVEQAPDELLKPLLAHETVHCLQAAERRGPVCAWPLILCVEADAWERAAGWGFEWHEWYYDLANLLIENNRDGVSRSRREYSRSIRRRRTRV
jgi:hypothetical protein